MRRSLYSGPLAGQGESWPILYMVNEYDKGGSIVRGAFGRRSRLVTAVVVFMVAGLTIMMFGGCGGDDADKGGSASTTASSATSGGSGGDSGGDGVALAEEILAAFDEVVAKAADLAKDKPEPATLKPQLEGLYDSYRPKMTDLNTRYRALREADIAEFGKCNTYLGDNRGKHVTAKDNTLTDAVKYYNFELGDQEMVDLLSKGPVELLDVAVKQN